MKINHDQPYWGFNNEKALERFKGTKFIGEFCLVGKSIPVAVYYSANPDRSKGHTDYFFLFQRKFDGKDHVVISGLNAKEMEEHRYQDAIHCLKCDEVIYSKYRHDFHYCTCGSVAIDGGRDYTKITGNQEDFETVILDLLKMKVISQRTYDLRMKKKENELKKNKLKFIRGQ